MKDDFDAIAVHRDLETEAQDIGGRFKKEN